MSETEDDFGAPIADVIPFGRFKADPVIVAEWKREKEAHNAKEKTFYQFKSPHDALVEMERKRGLPIMPLPGAWVDFARRARLYAGEIMAVSGPTGGGKTSFAIEMARACVGEGTPVVWLPKELDPPELNLRIVANSARTHVLKIREEWAADTISRALVSVVDRWRYVDDLRETPKQLDALDTAIKLAKRIYGRAPLAVVDYIGKFARGAKEIRSELADVIEELRLMAIRHDAFMLILSQTSRGNDAKLSGKIDMDNAADAIGVSAETSELEHAASVSIALNVFKTDDADALDAHVLIPKARGTGREGRVGFSFVKAGGSWRELDFIPATPNEVVTEVARQKKDRGRIAPAEPKLARVELNASKADRSAQGRTEAIQAMLRRSGMAGLGARELRRARGCGNLQRMREAVEELLSRGIIEVVSKGRWRIANQLNLA